VKTLRIPCFDYCSRNVICAPDGCIKHTTGNDADK
jgi:hypothetical protein